MNKHHQHRALLLQEVGQFPNDNLRKRPRAPQEISETDYAPVPPPPPNMSAQPAGDCLIWVGKMNADGYGNGIFPTDETLAHRQAFAQSRKSKAEAGVLHLCSRPFCVQPSHLYEGSHQDNSDDRRLLVDKDVPWASWNQKEDTVQRVAPYRWESPPTGMQPPLALKTAEVEHDCNFIIPAGDYYICDNCGQPAPEWLRQQPCPRELQPADKDRNSFSLVKDARTLTNVAEGLAIGFDRESTLDMPKNRSERRRRDREMRKHPNPKGPVFLGSHIIDPTNPTGTWDVNLSDFPLRGPGTLAMVIRVLPCNVAGCKCPQSLETRTETPILAKSSVF